MSDIHEICYSRDLFLTTRHKLHKCGVKPSIEHCVSILNIINILLFFFRYALNNKIKQCTNFVPIFTLV